MITKDIVEIVVLVFMIAVGGFGFGWFRILKETNNLLREQNRELKADNKEWQIKHTENVQRIASLEGEVKVLKDVPLKEINKNMEALVTLMEKLTTDYDVIIKALTQQGAEK